MPRLDAPGVERLTGAGIYYGGALSEAIATKGESIYIVGGGNSAGQAAMHFASYASCVTILTYCVSSSAMNSSAPPAKVSALAAIRPA